MFHLHVVPFSRCLEPEPKVLGLLPALAVRPEWQVDLLDRVTRLRAGKNDVAQLETAEGPGLANHAKKTAKSTLGREVLDSIPSNTDVDFLWRISMSISIHS